MPHLTLTRAAPTRTYLTPTQLGAKCTRHLSGRAVNEWLWSLGWQEPAEFGAWAPVGAGLLHGRVIEKSWRDRATGQTLTSRSLRWAEDCLATFDGLVVRGSR